MQRTQTFARFAIFAENRAARLAVEDLARSLAEGRPLRNNGLYLLHGPPGTGKSHLATALAAEAGQRRDLAITHLSASDLRELAQATDPKSPSAVREAPPLVPEFSGAAEVGLFILEDLQLLPRSLAERLVGIIDQRMNAGLPTVFTASQGPRDLSLRGEAVHARLSSRLASGLVVALAPLGRASRLAFLQDLAQRRQVPASGEILGWLADSLTGGGRQLEGAIVHLGALAKASRKPLDLEGVVRHFSAQAEANRPSVESIAARVSGYYRVRPAAIRSTSRQRGVLWPRQISMYLARRLTTLSLQQIGAYFGGRDHTTVLHACRKVEEALKTDAAVSVAVRELHAALG